MLQTIEGVEVYVVDFDVMPELPITWQNESEKPYAAALQTAIQDGMIREPGKYGIEIVENSPRAFHWRVHHIEE
jgi:hypothetical protein